MDGNYEAQSQFTKQRLAARREQGRQERLLREGQRESRPGWRTFLVQLFRRSGRSLEKKPAEASQSAILAITGKGKGQ